MSADRQPRSRPGDEFAKLQRRKQEARMEFRATGDWTKAMASLTELDRALWPVVLDALSQCAESGKLQSDIARFLGDAIDGGLAGKLPPSWPEPTGQRFVDRSDAEAADIVALYIYAKREGLLTHPRPNRELAELFGVTGRHIANWAQGTAATIQYPGGNQIKLSCVGLTIHYSKSEFGALDRILEHHLDNIAASYRVRRGLKPAVVASRVP